MRKLVFLCHRRPEITHETYVERLLAGHIPIALRHHPAMRRYAEGERKNNTDMMRMMEAISPAEREAIARYISSL